METKNNIEIKIDIILEKIEEQSRILEKNTESLIIHERRTDLAEHKLKILELELVELKRQEKEQIKELHEKIEPIAVHVHAVSWILKYVVPASAAIIIAMYKLGLFDNIKH